MSRKYPPGPINWNALFGLTWRHTFLTWLNPLRQITRLSRRYGDFVYFRLFKYHAYQIGRPDLIREVLVTKADSFIKLPRQMNSLRGVMGNGLVASEGDFWRGQRSQVKHAFSARQMAASAEIAAQVTQALVEKWSHPAQREITTDITTEITLLAMRISARTLLGTEPNALEGDLGQAVNDAAMALYREMSGVFSLPDWLPLPSKRRKHAAVAQFRNFIQRAFDQRYRERQQSGVPLENINLLTLLVNAVAEGKMTPQGAHDEAKSIFIAGYHSNSLSLAWTLHLLAENPDWQARVQTELGEVLAGNTPTFADVPRLTILTMVIKESLRLYPAAWAMFAREVAEDVELDGYKLKKGSWVLMYPWLTHHDPKLFPQPERFEPRRFAPDREQQISPFAYFPFGRGAHACIGGNLSMLQMTIVLATLLQRIQVASAPGKPSPVPVATLGLRSRRGIHLRLMPREVTARIVNETLVSRASS